MQVTLLGTGTPIPDPARAGAATLVRTSEGPFLFDAGRGVLMRLAAAGVFPIQLQAVLLTHLHSDHICDLNDVVTTHWVMTMEPTPLRIIGPPDTAAVIAGVQAMLAPDVRYRLAHHADLTWEPVLDVVEAQAGVVLEVGDVRITAAATDHRPVEPTLGYRVDDGGASVVLAGDTVPCEGLDELCAGAAVLVQTTLRHDIVAAAPMPRFRETVDYHSTIEQAAATAARAGVATLVLTHLVPGPPPGSPAVQEWHDLAAEHFSGEIVVGEDLTTIEVSTPA